MTVPPVAYLDASAAVKLLVAEPESGPLRDALAPIRHLLSSEVLGVELHCVAQRVGRDHADVEAVLAAFGLLVVDGPVLRRASRSFEPSQRALDAIHIASALRLAGRPAFFSYDHRQLAAARDAGLTVCSPGR